MRPIRPFDARRVVASTAGLIDRAVVAALSARRKGERARAASMSHAERMTQLAEVHAAYDADAGHFFPSPERASVDVRPVRPGVWEAAWASVADPFHDAVAERYRSRLENRTARARLYLAHPPGASSSRPAVIAIHGYLGGQWLLEENVWPIEWLSRRGLDVALLVLPFHGVRAGSRRGAPPFPSVDPRMTNEGFRQAVTDVRALARWLRDRGAPAVGVMGMSLGGYTASLTATVTDEIDFVAPIIPLASIADFAREKGHLGGGSEAEAQHAALERANRIVSPLARPLLLPPERALVIGAERDAITPIAHASRIARHFGCAMVTIPGAHLVQLGRAEGFRALAALLEREGIIPPRRR